MKRIVFLLILLAVSALSCTKNKIFEKYVDIENNRWKNSEAISFDVDIKDANIPYDVIVCVRHSTYYAFANLNLIVSMTTPQGENRVKPLTIFVRSSDGKFLGDGAGDLWDISAPAYEKLTFNSPGIYKFDITNTMPMYELPNILDVGLIVKKSK